MKTHLLNEHISNICREQNSLAQYAQHVAVKIYLYDEEKHHNMYAKCGTEFDVDKTNITYKTAKQKADYGKQYFNPDK